MRSNPQETVDLVTFTEEIFNGKLHFLCIAGLLLNLLETLENQRKMRQIGGIK